MMSPVGDRQLENAYTFIVDNLAKRVNKYGPNSFNSTHEGLGVIAEEYHELVEAVKSNENLQIINEASDVAVGCLWLIASMLKNDEHRNSEA